jgi:hypothetical protein
VAARVLLLGLEVLVEQQPLLVQVVVVVVEQH